MMKHSHHLTPDYFSVRAATEAPARNSALHDAGNNAAVPSIKDTSAMIDYADEDINDVATLLAKLKDCTMDREKIGLVLQYMEADSHDVDYLADQVCWRRAE